MHKINISRIRAFLPWLILGLYWPALFVSTHIPRLPNVKVYGHDVTLHIFFFMVLTLLFWLARYGRFRPSFTERKLYLTVGIMAVYGAVDEFTQKFVGRHCDIVDWYSDMGGVLIALLLLFLLRRPLHWLVAYWLVLLVVTHWPLEKPLVSLPDFLEQFQLVYVLVGYLILTLLWWRTMCPQPKFMFNKSILISTLFVLPIYALLAEVLCLIMRRGFSGGALLAALAGIMLGVFCSWAFAQHHLVEQE